MRLHPHIGGGPDNFGSGRCRVCCATCGTELMVVEPKEGRPFVRFDDGYGVRVFGPCARHPTSAILRVDD